MNKDEPRFVGTKWYFSTNEIWHRVINGYVICNHAIGKRKGETIDVDMGNNVCRRCLGILLNRRKK